MECPKCGLEIDDNAMVCPNCKKVLKLSCPICKTINESNTCRKCGYVIISKCAECGKINQTISKKCKKCGFDTEKSVIMNESNADEFVMLTIDFPNLDEMKNLLGTAKLFNKFKVNLDKIIADYAKSVGLRRQLIGKTYVVRFCKDYTFNSSAASALKGAIDILNLITAMNCKLSGKKNATIRCNMFLLKRSVEDDPYNIESGYNISLLSQNSKSKEQKILNTFQVLTDDSVSDAITGDYKISPLNSVMVNGDMVMFYEVDLREYITVEYPQDEETGEIEVPNFVQNLLLEQDKLDGEALRSLGSKKKDKDAIYDIDSINFEEIQCNFIRTENVDALYHILNRLQTAPKGIIALKTLEMYKPYSIKILNTVAETGQFNNIITVTCYDEMKYTPYSFFRELVSAIFEYTVSQKLFSQNDFTMFKSVDPDGLIKDLITLKERENDEISDKRTVYFDIFLTMLQVVPKTLIFIEDFDKIDESSYEVMKFIFGRFDELDISILVNYDKEFSLHKDCHFLLMDPNYTEITLKPTSFEKIIEDNKNYYRNILNDFYFHRIAKYACGSSLFIDFALQYLIESGVYAADDDSVEMVNPETIIIPSSLDKLISRRLNLLQDDVETMKFLTSIVLLGARIDMATINSLGYSNTKEMLEKLSSMGYLYEYNNCIYFPNYNLLRRNLLYVVSKISLDDAAHELFDKVFTDEMPSPVKAYLYGLMGDKDNERDQWERLAKVNESLGDFKAFVNCCDKIIEILDDTETEENAEEFKAYKAKIYQSISDNLFDYVPKKSFNIAQTTLSNIEKTGDSGKIIELCNKMINGALIAGDYHHALELTHKVLSLLPLSSLNPADPNFNTYFFLMTAAHIQILFNIGSLIDCVDVGYKVLNVVNNETIPVLKPEYYSDEAFKQLIIDSAGYVCLGTVLLLGANIKEFLNILNGVIDFLPKSFSLFIALDDFIKGNPVSLENVEFAENDRFALTIYNFICAFTQSNGDYNKFAEFAYRAKIAAKDASVHILELFSDLLIAYAYMAVDSYEKSENILYNVIQETSRNGMISILYVAWLLMSELHLKQDKYDVAYGIVNNSLIQLEKNNITSEYILMMFKYTMYKVMMFKQQFDKAEICIAQAGYIANKYGIKFNFDNDPSHYIPVDTETDVNVTEDELNSVSEVENVESEETKEETESEAN